MALRYVTVNDVCQYLTVDGSNPDIAAEVEVYASIAESLIDEVVNYSFTPQTNLVVKYDTKSTDTYLFFGTPISALASLAIIDVDGGVVRTLTKYSLQPRFGFNHNPGIYLGVKLKAGERFATGVEALKATITTGFPTIPKPIQLCVYLITKHIMALRDIDENFASTSFIDRAQTLEKTRSHIPASVKVILEKWKLHDLTNYTM